MPAPRIPSTARGGAYGSSPEHGPRWGQTPCLEWRPLANVQVWGLTPLHTPRPRPLPSRTCIAAAACAKSRPRSPLSPALPARAPTCPPSASPPMHRTRRRQRRRPRRCARPRRLHRRRARRGHRRQGPRRRPRFPQAHRRRRLRRGQHHAAVGVGVVGRRRRHDARRAVAVPLALRADRAAGGRLCRPALLPLGRPGAARRAASTWTCRSRSASRSPPP